MRISRSRCCNVMVAGLVCLAVGCGAGDRGGEMMAAPEDVFDAVTSTLPGPETAGPESAEPLTAEPAEGAVPDETGAGDILSFGVEGAAVEAEPPGGAWGGAALAPSGGSTIPRVEGAPPPSPAPPSVTTFEPPPPPPPAASVDHVDAIVSKLKQGNIAYNAPETMQYDETREIELLLSPTESAEQLQTALRDQRDVRSDSAPVANRMEARLTGIGFEIESIDTPVQVITSLRPTRWRWRVTPVSSGLLDLNLSLDAHIMLPDGIGTYVITTKDKVIQVEITVAQQVSGFVEANWQWLWATLVFPVVGYRHRRRRWSRNENHETYRKAA